MLVQFSIKNFSCFKEKDKFSFVASNYDKITREKDNVFGNEKFGLRLLKSAVVYGANASGKSKFIEGFHFLQHFLYNSAKESQLNEAINIKPFLLSSETYKEPSCFEIVFTHQVMYRYGLEVDKDKVHSEWLFYKPHTKEVELFYRTFQMVYGKGQIWCCYPVFISRF